MNRRSASAAMLCALAATPARADLMGWFNGVKVGARLPEHDTEYLNAPPTGEPRLTLIDFWATWCAPCREEIPHLNRLHAQFREAGLGVMGLTQESREVALPFLAKVPMDYPVGAGGRRPLQKALGIRALPYALIVDRSQVIVWRGQASSLTPQDVEARLRAAA